MQPADSYRTGVAIIIARPIGLATEARAIRTIDMVAFSTGYRAADRPVFDNIAPSPTDF